MKVRTDDENAKFIKLRRPTKKVIKDEIVIFSPPEITGKVQVSYVNENGDRIRQYNKGEKVSVKRDGDPVDLGNGTLVVVNFSYYDTAKGPGHRMESLTVLDLVEYNKEVNVPETKVEENKEETQAPKKVDLDDDIPF